MVGLLRFAYGYFDCVCLIGFSLGVLFCCFVVGLLVLRFVEFVDLAFWFDAWWVGCLVGFWVVLDWLS